MESTLTFLGSGISSLAASFSASSFTSSPSVAAALSVLAESLSSCGTVYRHQHSSGKSLLPGPTLTENTTYLLIFVFLYWRFAVTVQGFEVFSLGRFSTPWNRRRLLPFFLLFRWQVQDAKIMIRPPLHLYHSWRRAGGYIVQATTGVFSWGTIQYSLCIVIIFNSTYHQYSWNYFWGLTCIQDLDDGWG